MPAKKATAKPQLYTERDAQNIATFLENYGYDAKIIKNNTSTTIKVDEIVESELRQAEKEGHNTKYYGHPNPDEDQRYSDP